MQGKVTYIRPKVVGPFTGSYANGSYVLNAGKRCVYDVMMR
jgi:hypothetical protein